MLLYIDHPLLSLHLYYVWSFYFQVQSAEEFPEMIYACLHVVFDYTRGKTFLTPNKHREDFRVLRTRFESVEKRPPFWAIIKIVSMWPVLSRYRYESYARYRKLGADLEVVRGYRNSLCVRRKWIRMGPSCVYVYGTGELPVYVIAKKGVFTQ